MTAFRAKLVTVAQHFIRQAGRVVLIGPGPSVLLLSGRDPEQPRARPFWFVPGGGAESGETPEAAARREVLEEVGRPLGALGPAVWRRRARFSFAGSTYDQEEWFFVERTECFRPRATSLTSLELRFTTGARWWPLDELEELAAQSALGNGPAVYPAELPRLVSQWLAHGPGTAPVLIE